MSEKDPAVVDGADLVEQATLLIGEVRALRGDLASKRSLRRTWRIVVVDVLLSVVGLGLWYSQVETNHRLETSLHQNYTTAQQQVETRTRVLCPLYSLLLASVSDPTPRAPGTPAQQAQFAKAVATIRSGYTTLGCAPALSNR